MLFGSFAQSKNEAEGTAHERRLRYSIFGVRFCLTGSACGFAVRSGRRCFGVRVRDRQLAMNIEVACCVCCCAHAFSLRRLYTAVFAILFRNARRPVSTEMWGKTFRLIEDKNPAQRWAGGGAVGGMAGTTRHPSLQTRTCG